MSLDLAVVTILKVEQGMLSYLSGSGEDYGEVN